MRCSEYLLRSAPPHTSHISIMSYARRRRGHRSDDGVAPAPAGSAWVGNNDDDRQQQQQQQLRRRRRSKRKSGGRCHHETICDGVIFGLMWWYYGLFVVLFAGGRSRVGAQFVDGGAVALTCGACQCTGTSDDGSIVVFDNLSTGDRVSEHEPTTVVAVC